MDDPLIVISNGMAKSASTLMFHHTRLLMKHQFPDNGQLALCQAICAGKLGGSADEKEAGMAFVTHIGDRELDVISEIALSEGPIVVKTHGDTNPAMVEAVRSRRVRMTFTHRDPRDMILSGMDHCVQTRSSEQPSLQEFTSIPNCMASARWWARVACNWVSSGLPLVILYTDLVATPARELARLADYLGVAAGDGVLRAVIESELAVRRLGQKRFNRGELHRYSLEMSPEDQALCDRELGEFITKLGYQL